MNSRYTIILWIWSLLVVSFSVAASSPTFAIDYSIAPGHQLFLANPKSTAVRVACQISFNSTATNSVSIYVVEGRGVFNGTSLKQGDTAYQSLRNAQSVFIDASAGAKARFTNVGSYTVKAHCE